MPIRRRMRRRRTLRLRRGRRLRIPRRNITRYTGYTGRCIDYSAAMQYSTVTGDPWFTVDLCGATTAASTGGTYINYFGTAESAQATQYWAQYRFIGARVTFIPAVLNGDAAAQHRVQHALNFEAQVTLTGGTSDNALRALPGYKMIPMSRPYKRYFRLKRYLRSLNVNWLNNTASPTPTFQVFFKTQGANETNGQTMATVYVRWYVQFRGFSITQI